MADWMARACVHRRSATLLEPEVTSSYRATAAKLYALLTPVERKRALGLLGLMVLGMGLETLSVGLVIPAVALLVQGDAGATLPWLGGLLEASGSPSRPRLVVLGMLALVAVYLIKAVFLALLTWYQNRVAFGVQERISRELFANYLRQPYTFHLQRNSAELIRNAVNEVNQFWFFILNPVLVALGEGLVLLGICALLFTIEPVGALVVVLVLGIAGGVFHGYFRARLFRLGQERQGHYTARLQRLQEGLGGIKEIKLLGREPEVAARYAVHNTATARVERLHATLQPLPRIWIELLAIAAMAALVVALVLMGRDPAAILPTLGLFAAAAFRLMPSASRVLNTFQNVPYGLPSVNTLHEELVVATATDAESQAGADPAAPRGPALTFQREIRLSGVEFSYPGAHEPALAGLSLAIERGGSVGFVGPSGSGKTTLVDIVLGLLTPTKGEVTVDGRNIKENLRSWQRQLGYVPQSVYLTDESLRANVAFGLPSDRIDEAAVVRALAAAQLEKLVASLPAGIHTFVGERGVRLSGGQRQRVGIARALYHDPPVLVLDEATSALDAETERGVMEAVAALQGNKTLLIVAHRMSTVEHCSRLYRLERGTVTAEGSPSELLRGVR